jgi:restriction system protein
VLFAATHQSDPLSTVLHSLAKLWPLWVLVAIVGAGKLALWIHQELRLRRAGIADVDRMDGATFERFLVSLFRRLGYRVEHTGRRGDFGADLVIAKEGQRTVVQAKCWSKNVGVGAVQEAVAAKGYYKCDDVLVVTNRRFTEPARKLARANLVTLWARDELVAKLLAVGGAEATVSDTVSAAANPTAVFAVSATATPPATASAVDAPAGAASTDSPEPAHCVTCGAVVSMKVRDYCLARPKRFGGRVYCYRHQRSAPAPA